MNVNKERLERLIVLATEDCYYCPLFIKTVPCDTKSCISTLIKWLTEFDIPTALEEGAHIVNDRAIFPPQEVEITKLEVDEE